MEQITQDYWENASKEALIRYRSKAERYGLVLDWDGITCFYGSISGVAGVLSWERVYYIVLKGMDEIEDESLNGTFEVGQSTKIEYPTVQKKTLRDRILDYVEITGLTIRESVTGISFNATDSVIKDNWGYDL